MSAVTTNDAAAALEAEAPKLATIDRNAFAGPRGAGQTDAGPPGESDGGPPAHESPRRPKYWLLLLIAAVVAAAIGAGIYASRQPVPPQIQGMIETHEIRVSLKTPGRALRFLADEGDTVKRGQLLARMSTPEVASGLADVRRALASETLTQATLRRFTTLFEKGWLPAQRLEEAQADAKSASEAVKAAQSKVGAMTDGARVVGDGEELEVIAPLDGEIVTKVPNEGELVPTGYALFSMIDISDVWLSLNVREDQFRSLKIGDKIEGEIPALGKTAQFTVYYISAEGDFATWRATRQSSGYDVRSFEVRARPTSPIKALRPGMSVLVAIPSSPRP